MNKSLQIKKVDIEKGTRIIAVSDLHGCADYLEGVLAKVEYTPADVLVIVGDVIEKGKESLRTVRSILKLKEANPHVYVTMGNVDYDRIGLFDREGEQAGYDFEGTLRWTKKVWKRGLFLDMLSELQIDLDTVNGQNIGEIKARMREKFAKELGLFEELPTVLEIGDYIFVHAGIPTDDLTKLRQEDMFSYLKRDTFLKEDVTFSKNVVVGHWPVCLYRDDIDCMNPIFDYEKHIVAIDGGCALKEGAQLNALLIPDAHAELGEVSFAAYDNLPVITASKPQAGKERTITIRYFDCKVELLEDCGDVARVRHVNSGKEFVVPKKYLYGSEDKYFKCSDFSDAWLEVAEGEELSVVKETSRGYIVKKDGVIGWYMFS